MIRFNSDYTEGAHPAILKRLAETNLEQTPGYGEDAYCSQAAAKIKKLCANDAVDVHFLVGGTQTNLTVIATALRPHQSVISVVSGHISVHETGAIEATGHKVEALPGVNGKLSADQVEQLYLSHVQDESFEHITQPKMVYISNPTELGTLYSRAELQAIHAVCRKHSLYLFLDGARLGYGLASPKNELDLPFITECCDVFYIGGTKVGALFGEAVVIKRDELKQDFRYMMKQRGGMLAKGRLLGIQFDTLFSDDLYFQISAHAIEAAMALRDGFRRAGFDFLIDSPTNQQFPILADAQLEKLREKYGFSYIQRVDAQHSAVRFCTSWATRMDAVNQLIADLQTL